jgi:hypothetical protein
MGGGIRSGMTDASHERMWKLRVLLPALVVVATATDSVAVSGSLALRAQVHLTVHRCGGFGDRFPATVQFRDDGTWTASSDGPTFSGTYTMVDTNGRKLGLAFDPPSESGFVASLVADASELCRTAVTVSSLTTKAFQVTFNRKGNRGKLNIRFVATGTGGGRSGRATWRLGGRGRWTAG